MTADYRHTSRQYLNDCFQPHYISHYYHTLSSAVFHCSRFYCLGWCLFQDLVEFF
ncbi:hypothetical protein BD560DRAFT_410639 [Blakeslea trispora]|nr:hypothetical protein BD560DRAFT_410639 [Blakeslea trispora]